MYKTTKKLHEFGRPTCCYNHYLGLPKKHGRPLPIFDYELEIVDTLEDGNDNIEIIKARGLGITEILLRYPTWRALRNRNWYGRTAALITGLTFAHSTELITRIRGFYVPFGIFFDSKADTLELNGVRFKSFPAQHVDTLRSFTDFCYVFLDEAGFFPKKAQTQLREAVEGYRLKSKPIIIWNSTPGQPDDVMQGIENEIKEGKSRYRLIKLPYTRGLGKIYDPEEVEYEKTQFYFPREFELKYSYGVGDVFTEEEIARCFDVKYDPEHIYFDAPKCIGIDPTYGGSSSKFAFVVTQKIGQHIQLLEATAIDKPDPKFIEEYSKDTIRKYKLFASNGNVYGRVLVDRANQLYIRYLKREFGERVNYDDEGPVTREMIKKMKIAPILFFSYHREMFVNMKQLVARGHVLIDENKFPELVKEMRIAKAGPDFNLLKGGNHPTHDLLDAFRIALFGYSFE